jgi:hypothetical protein
MPDMASTSRFSGIVGGAMMKPVRLDLPKSGLQNVVLGKMANSSGSGLQSRRVARITGMVRRATFKHI